MARDQIAAATGRALESLRAQITAETIGNGLTVQDLLDKTRTTKKFMQTLRRAQQIGGPRWLDPQTCQVRLEIGVSDHFVTPTVSAILGAARTGDVGDGKIFVLPVEKVYRIRTAEEDQAAVTPVEEAATAGV